MVDDAKREAELSYLADRTLQGDATAAFDLAAVVHREVARRQRVRRRKAVRWGVAAAVVTTAVVSACVVHRSRRRKAPHLRVAR